MVPRVEPSPAPPPRWRAIFPALLALLAVTHAPLFAGRSVVFRDTWLWVIPARALVRDALVAGRLPRWNPFVGLGFSVPAEPLYGLFYPPHLATTLAFADVAWGASLDAWLHLLLGALGCAALASRLGARSIGAVVAGAAWSLSGPIQSEWTCGVRLYGLAWLPWCAVAAVDLAAAPPGAPWRRAALRAAVPVALAMLAGEPFIALFGVLFGAALALGASDRARWPRTLAGLAAAALGGTLLAAPTLAPMIAGAASSQRAAPLTRAAAEAMSMHPWRLLDLGVFGGVGLAWSLRIDPLVNALLDPAPLLESMYLGSAVVLLAALGVGRARARVALVALALAGVVLALGRHTPVHGVWRLVALPFRYMRSPEKYLALTTVAVAVLAGLGVERLRDRRPALLAVTCAAGIYVALWVTARAWMPMGLSRVMPQGAVIGLATAAMLGTAAALGERRATLAAVLVVAAVALDLGENTRRFPRWGDGASLRREPAMAAAVRATGPRGAAPRLYRSDALERSRRSLGDALGFLRVTMRANTNGLYGVAEVPGYDVGVPPETSAVAERRRIDALRVLSVDAALMPTRAGALPAGLERLYEVAPGATLYRVLETLPRAYVARESVGLSIEAARAHLLDAEVVSGRRVLLIGPPTTGIPSNPGVMAAACRPVSSGDGERVVDCDAPAGGHAVFIEQWTRGWRATVDERAAGPVLQANLVGLAVPLAPSPRPQRVRVWVTAPGERAGVVLGALAWAALGVGLWLSSRARARSEAHPPPG
jgi:hypothetical protein